MWKPEERIKFSPSTGRWPTQDEAASAMLFQPIRVGEMELASRTWVPAMVPWRATNEGVVTDSVVAWYRRFAEGLPGAIVVEATGIRDIPSGPLLRIGDDRFLPGLKRIVDAVREASGGRTHLFIQLIDFLTIRRRPKREDYFNRFLKISDDHRRSLGLDGASEPLVRSRLLDLSAEELAEVLTQRELEDLEKGYREYVTDMHLPHVAQLPQVLPALFADAAVRARDAGFDGIELHYAHAYTMASFLSAKNNRSDGYGGDLAGRVRLPLEVYRAVRDAVGDSIAVGCRMLTDECIDGGSSIDDACYFAAAFADAGVDFISTSRGGKFDDAANPNIGWAAYPYTGPSGYECMPQYLSDAYGPFGRNFDATGRIRAAVRAAGSDVPVIVVGGIHNFEQAEMALQKGYGDIAGLARQALADPDWFRKVQFGNGAAVRLCEYTNYCEGLDQKHKTVTCNLWDRVELDQEGAILSPNGKRRLVAPPWTPENERT